jgi:hypothetical protein
MRRVAAFFLFLFLAFISTANANTFTFAVPPPYDHYSGEIRVVSDHGPDEFFLNFGYTGGPQITGGNDPYLSGGNPADYSEFNVVVSFGSVTNVFYGCNESDFHCSRGDTFNFGFANTDTSIPIFFSEFVSGPYAVLGPASLYLDLPAGFNVVPVPESSTWALLLIGFAGIGFARYLNRGRDTRTTTDQPTFEAPPLA